jgi:hypothetical protein
MLAWVFKLPSGIPKRALPFEIWAIAFAKQYCWQGWGQPVAEKHTAVQEMLHVQAMSCSVAQQLSPHGLQRSIVNRINKDFNIPHGSAGRHSAVKRAKHLSNSAPGAKQCVEHLSHMRAWFFKLPSGIP